MRTLLAILLCCVACLADDGLVPTLMLSVETTNSNVFKAAINVVSNRIDRSRFAVGLLEHDGTLGTNGNTYTAAWVLRFDNTNSPWTVYSFAVTNSFNAALSITASYHLCGAWAGSNYTAGMGCGGPQSQLSRFHR